MNYQTWMEQKEIDMLPLKSTVITIQVLTLWQEERLAGWKIIPWAQITQQIFPDTLKGIHCISMDS